MMTCSPVQADSKKLSCDEIKEYNVYSYTLRKPERAYAIIQELKRAGKTPAFDMHRIEGDYYFNRSYYFQALFYYKRMLRAHETSRDIQKQIETYRRLIPCNKELHNYISMKYYAEELLECSRKADDIQMEATALFAIGEATHAYGKRKEAYKHMWSAIETLKQDGLAENYDLAYYFYITIAEYQQRDRLPHQASHTLDLIRKEFNHAIYPNGSGLEVLTNMRLKDIYAHRTVLAWMQGKTTESQAWYEKFKTVGNDSCYNYQDLHPYLAANNKQADIEHYVDVRKAYLKSIQDTLSKDYIAISQMLITAYINKGEYQKANALLQQVNKTYDQKNNMERRAMMQELSSTNQLYEQKMDMKRLQVYCMLGIVVSLISFIAFYLWWTIRTRRIMVTKNRSMAATINELIKYKDLNAKQERLISTTAIPSTTPKDRNEILYNKVKAYLAQPDVFTRSSLNREELLERFNIPKNLFSSLFTQYEGISYTQYLTNIRLEHAVHMLKEYPQYSIDYVAEQSGMSVPTLYRLFSQKYGMTPAEYRENSGHEIESCPNDSN
uniref:Helix-turn-helix transcriptional regulator n=1 Tax=Prevotella sp. GTC17259 TaxID=3236795 RepID=A0AB33J2E6_9BACT